LANKVTDFTKLMTVHAGNLQLLQDKLCAPGDNPALKAFLYLLVSLYHGPTPALVAGHEIARGSLSGMEVTISSDVPVGAGIFCVFSRTCLPFEASYLLAPSHLLFVYLNRQ
jgi:hypothetical protein